MHKERLSCSSCGEAHFSSCPDIFIGKLHKGCGGHYEYAKGNKGCQGRCIYKAPLAMRVNEETGERVIWCSKNGAWMVFNNTPCADHKDREKGGENHGSV